MLIQTVATRCRIALMGAVAIVVSGCLSTAPEGPLLHVAEATETIPPPPRELFAPADGRADAPLQIPVYMLAETRRPAPRAPLAQPTPLAVLARNRPVTPARDPLPGKMAVIAKRRLVAAKLAPGALALAASPPPYASPSATRHRPPVAQVRIRIVPRSRQLARNPLNLFQRISTWFAIWRLPQRFS